ncbi:MAG: hypothetical protein AB7U71_10505 [Comamonas sp.]
MKTPNANTITEAIRKHIVIVGSEIEFSTGIRAVAAERFMESCDISDPDMLFDVCEGLIGTINLYESYDDPRNTEPGELVLGQGLPLRSLEAYIALSEHFGPEWLTRAMEFYAEHHAALKLGKDAKTNARKLVDRARCCFDLDSAWHGKVASDGLGRYQRFERIANMNAYLTSAA